MLAGPKYLMFVSTWLSEALDSGLLALCGPNRVLHESSCECVCRNGLTEDSCDPGWKLAHDTCKQAFKLSTYLELYIVDI